MGSPNGYFHNRMDTASELWKDGKATVFIVSGDNSSHAYNEPEWMKLWWNVAFQRNGLYVTLRDCGLWILSRG